MPSKQNGNSREGKTLVPTLKETQDDPKNCELHCCKPWKQCHQLANAEVNNTEPSTEEVTNASHSAVNMRNMRLRT